MHSYAKTNQRFMGEAPSALFCPSPSQRQVCLGFPRRKAACLQAVFGWRLFLGSLLAHDTAVSNHLRG